MKRPRHADRAVQVDELPPAKHAAIHRALLAGLLGNVGVKGDTHEYSGARGTKFSVFPGSAMFKQKPAWLMSAEIVETTKLYARTNAPARPEWIEALAQHLVKREYFEPHWQDRTGHVVAYEKVSLYGLVLVQKRLVHYGPIDPVAARRIFIENALVEMDFRTDATYMRHNRELIEHVEQLEAKARRRDILADPDQVFAFFDERLPPDVYNGPLLDQWRKTAERQRPDVLFLPRAVLLKRDPIEISVERFPDQIEVAGVPIELEYRFDIASGADGITAIIPLAALNQITGERFDWLVPGMLREKILELIRSLPKNLRTLFIPNADVAEEAAQALGSAEGPLVEALSLYLGRRAGTVIPRNAFDPKSLAPYLHMNFRVIDEGGRVLAESRDLEEIRRALRVELQQTFNQLPRSEFHRDNITNWDFGDLPDKIEVKRHGLTLAGYPALVEEGSKVAIRTLDSAAASITATRAGVRRLFMIQLTPELRRIVKTLPDIGRMSVDYAIIGKPDDLRADLASAIADRALALAGFPRDLRTKDEFVRLAEDGWRFLGQSWGEINSIVAQTLENNRAIADRLIATHGVALHDSMNDMRRQVARLVYPGFIAATKFEWLQHLPRYIKAVDVRLKKLLNAGLNRDVQQMSIVQPYLEDYLDKRRQNRMNALPDDAALDTFGWMIEELRVSLFAQELKTAMPISPQRLDKQWMMVM